MTTSFATGLTTSSKILFPIWSVLETAIEAANGVPSAEDDGVSTQNASVGILAINLGTATSVDIRFWGVPRRSTGWYVLQGSTVEAIDVDQLLLVDLSSIERFYCEVTATDGSVTVNFGGST